MHEPILDRLEEYLSGNVRPETVSRFDAHLSECAGCRNEVRLFEAQARALRGLRAPEVFDPGPGFYARVLDKIDAQSSHSLWGMILEPIFARRLMYASLALLLVLSTAAVTVLNRPAMHEAVPFEIMADSSVLPSTGADVVRDREVVFSNLASYTGVPLLVATSN